MVYFCQIFDVFFSLYNPFFLPPPPDTRRPLHMLYICIATFNCPKGILGLGGKASKNKLKEASFIFSMTNVTILSIFRKHAQKEFWKWRALIWLKLFWFKSCHEWNCILDMQTRNMYLLNFKLFSPNSFFFWSDVVFVVHLCTHSQLSNLLDESCLSPR